MMSIGSIERVEISRGEISREKNYEKKSREVARLKKYVLRKEKVTLKQKKCCLIE